MIRCSLPLAVVACLLTTPLLAGDWPQFRYDPGRTAASPDDLPTGLQLRWTRQLPAPQPAFPDATRLGFDASYEPVVLGRTMFVPSMIADSVTALDTETGDQRWRFTAEGPVRFAPVAWEGKVYFVSDDGYLYCVDAETGSLHWKFRGLPAERADRKVIGNGRLVSLWPARGGPVLAEGVVYFAAGLWPSEGVFVHAVDANSGQAVWSNTKCDLIPKSNWDHGIGQHSGLTPQGYLAILGDKLVVPCGVQLPAFLDLKTGELQTYTMGWGGRVGLPKGCWFVAGVGKYLSHSGDLYDITRPNDEQFADPKPGAPNYKPMLYPGGFTRVDIERANQRELDSFRQPVLTLEVMYESGQEIVARDLTGVTLKPRTPASIPGYRLNDTYPDNVGGIFRQLWQMPSKLAVHIKAGSRLYVGGPGAVEAIDIASSTPQVVWRAEFQGTPQRMLAADGKLFIATAEGAILAFAAPQASQSLQPGGVTEHAPSPASPAPADPWTQKAATILAASGARDGYALVLGLDHGRLVEELVQQSNLHVIAVDEDAAKGAALRERLHQAGLYGTRACVLIGDPLTYRLPPYVANLVVSEDLDSLQQAGGRALVQAVFHTLRPYGGVACAWGTPADGSRLEQIVSDGVFPGAGVRQAGELVLLARSGPLPGAADWSHAEANAASTGASEDEFIRSPMAVLWFDASHRWHKFPGQVQVRVAAGRNIVLEEGLLRASDVYTGRKLWEIEVSVGSKPVSRSVREARHREWGPQPSLPAATDLVVIDDTIYLSDGKSCLVFDAANGQQTGSIELPEDLEKPWSKLRIDGDYLVGSSGRYVLCFHRRTGELLWRYEAARASLSLAVGGDKVFCAEVADTRRGEDETRDGSMFALNIATGQRVWQRPGGARLRYSAPLDIVVTPVGFYRGSDGQPVPRSSNATATRFVVQGGGLPEAGQPGFVAGRRLLTGTEETLLVYDLPSGELVGKPLQWVRRGCTGTRASTHLLTTRYRSNSAWIDLATGDITSFLGVRPGCSVNNNLYPANGVLNMPNLTGGCTCNHAPVSLACVPAAAIERDGAD